MKTFTAEIVINDQLYLIIGIFIVLFMRVGIVRMIKLIKKIRRQKNELQKLVKEYEEYLNKR